jgi:branched-subunit amino acid ABC-type transport system permease component
MHCLRDFPLIVLIILVVGLWIYKGRVETGKTVRASRLESGMAKTWMTETGALVR